MLIVTRPWPWGLVWVRDSSWPEAPPQVDGQHAVYATHTEIGIQILHEVDGEATVEIAEVAPQGLQEIWTGEIGIPSGTLVVTDSGEERVDRLALHPGEYLASVFVDDVTFPERVVVAISPRAEVDSSV